MSLVAPHVGAWIEIGRRIIQDIQKMSHPTWVRGLKSLKIAVILAPAGSHPTWVRGLKFTGVPGGDLAALSHPTWVRGLKSVPTEKSGNAGGRTPRGCVD